MEFVDPATLAQQKPGANINIEGVVLEVGPLVQGEKLRKVTVAFFPGAGPQRWKKRLRLSL